MTNEQEDYAKEQEAAMKEAEEAVAELTEEKKRRIERLFIEAEDQEFCIMEVIEAYRECGNIKNSFALNRLLGLVERELVAALDKNCDAHCSLIAIRDKMDKGNFDKISGMCDEIRNILSGHWHLTHDALRGEITHKRGKEIIRGVERALTRVLNKTSDILSLRPF